MNKNDYEQFCLTLNGCIAVVGRGRLDKAAADIFYMKLAQYDLQTVQWALVECTDLIDNGYEYNVRLIKKTIEKQLNVNKFREDAMKRLMQQEKTAKDLTEYLESDEFKENQTKGKEVFLACKEMLSDDV